MAARLSKNVVDHVLMGPEKEGRFTQDSPVLPDVWFSFGMALGDPLDLLITPYEDQPAPKVAAKLSDAVYRYRKLTKSHDEQESPDIAALQGGVVVVAAAGNRGYQRFETKAGLFESYAAFSITDQGNAEKIIAVGATHRYWPYT